MTSSTIRLTLVAAASVASFAFATAASAGTGCNGYINQMQWGCAPWDNNNGPQYPHYRAPAPAPAAVVRTTPSYIRQAPAPSLPKVLQGNGIVAQGGGNAISHDGSSLVGNDGSSFHH